MAVKNLTIQRVGSALRPTQINHGDVWGHGKDWFTFYCPNADCKRQLSGETKCPIASKTLFGNPLPNNTQKIILII